MLCVCHEWIRIRKTPSQVVQTPDSRRHFFTNKKHTQPIIVGYFYDGFSSPPSSIGPLSSTRIRGPRVWGLGFWKLKSRHSNSTYPSHWKETNKKKQIKLLMYFWHKVCVGSRILGSRATIEFIWSCFPRTSITWITPLGWQIENCDASTTI